MSVLADRYASAEMKAIWSRRERIILERKFWISVMRAEQELGLGISESEIARYESQVQNIDLDSIDRRELNTHHDVKARLDEFNELAGSKLAHIGMTSRDLTENAELIQICRGLEVVSGKLLVLLNRFADRAEEMADVPVVARTHNIPAQLTSMGKRFATWGEELKFALLHLQEFKKRLPFRGIKGASGTGVDIVEIFGDRAGTLDESILKAWGFGVPLKATGQIYPRSIDFELISLLSQIAAAPSNLALNVRLMSGLGLVSEGLTPEQIGSSAMPHKVNPRLSERLNALAILIKGYTTMAHELSGNQWNEGDVSCSAVRRVLLPESFFAIDGILDTAIYLLDRLEINRVLIDREVRQNLPELTSSLILSHAIKKGRVREGVYQAIRTHAQEARRDLLETGEETFLTRITSDPEIGIDIASYEALTSNILQLCGLAPVQAREFAHDVRLTAPIPADYADYKPGVIR